MELLAAVVDDVKLVTFVVDSFFLGFRLLLFLLFVTAVTYSGKSHNIISKMKTIVGVMVTINY